MSIRREQDTLTLAVVSLTSYQQSNGHRRSNDEMQTPVIITALLILCLIHHGALVSALKPRERLPAEKRIDFLGVKSDWSPLNVDYCPRFKEDSKVLVREVDAAEFHTYQSVKIAFRFHGFRSTWITVSSGNGHFLSSLTVTFFHSDSDILRVAFHPVYAEEAVLLGNERKSFQPKSFDLRYVWVSSSPVETDSGRRLTWTASLFLSLIVAFFVVRHRLLAGMVYQVEQEMVHVEPPTPNTPSSVSSLSSESSMSSMDAFGFPLDPTMISSPTGRVSLIRQGSMRARSSSLSFAPSSPVL